MTTLSLLDRMFPKAKDFSHFAPPDGELALRTLPFIWIFVKALRVSIITVTLCYAVGFGSFMLEPYFIGRIVDAIGHSSREEVWETTGRLVVLYLLIAQLLGMVLAQIGHISISHLLPILTVTVRRRLAQYLFSHSYRYFQDDYAGRLAGKVVEMPQAVHDVVDTMLDSGVYLVANFLVSIVLFSMVKWYFTLTLGCLVLYSLLICLWRVPLLSREAELAAAATQAMRGRYLDSITNILLVKLFGREQHEDRLFSAATVTAGTASQQHRMERVMLWRLQYGGNFAFQATLVLLAIHGYRSSQLTVGQITTVLTLGAAFITSMWWLLRASVGLFAQFAIIKEALATIVQPAEVRDEPAAKPLDLGQSGIRFEGMTFAYATQPVFDGFTLDVKQGQRVGLVGPSGAGKSTLVQLLLRLFDVQGGAIRVGGQDIREVAQRDLRNAIAMIPQATDLMHRSIRDNIAYGRLDATEEEIVEAARKASIHDTILGLKDSHGNAGYDSLVGERGVKLSGGQRQRIAIARAFLKNAPILILDEATSALDSESERLIQQSFDELFKGRTVIAIAHRLSTIAHLDRIVVMESGKIVEDGPHEQLVKASGLYARLWQLQSAGFIGV